MRDDGSCADLAGGQPAGGDLFVCLRAADAVLGSKPFNAVGAVMLVVRRNSGCTRRVHARTSWFRSRRGAAVCLLGRVDFLGAVIFAAGLALAAPTRSLCGIHSGKRAIASSMTSRTMRVLPPTFTARPGMFRKSL